MKTYTHMKRKAMTDADAINAIADYWERIWADDVSAQVHLFDRGAPGQRWLAHHLLGRDRQLRSHHQEVHRQGGEVCAGRACVELNAGGYRPSLASDRMDVSMGVLFSPTKSQRSTKGRVVGERRVWAGWKLCVSWRCLTAASLERPKHSSSQREEYT